MKRSTQRRIRNSLYFLVSAAPSKAPPPPPPPPGDEKKDDVHAAAAEEEDEFELPFKILGHPVKIPKLPPVPGWIRVMMEFRFPASMDPYTGTKSHRVLESFRVSLLS